MGKHEVFTPKAIAKKIKAKGLQKLRWYCQMCEKQCRDENGFKCHCASESHQRQMEIFGMNTGKHISDFSHEFEKTFMDIMKRSYRHTRVLANIVYNEIVKDRTHTHMNATRWASLSGFVQYLAQAGKCKIEDSPKGWYLTYIDRDPETMLKEGQKRKRISAEAAAEDRQEREIRMQIKRANNRAANAAESSSAQAIADEDEDKLLQNRDDENVEKVAFSLKKKVEDGAQQEATQEDVVKDATSTDKKIEDAGRSPDAEEVSPDGIVHAAVISKKKPATTTSNAKPPKSPMPSTMPVLKRADEKPRMPTTKQQQAKTGKKPLTAMEELMLEEEQKREKNNRRDYWLCEGIVVKVMAKKLADGAYYKKKGVVRSVTDKYLGEVSMLDSGHVLKIDQEELETVIPQVGGAVKVVNGAYRGCNAKLLSCDIANFCVDVAIVGGPFDGRTVSTVAYEDVCKAYSG